MKTYDARRVTSRSYSAKNFLREIEKNPEVASRARFVAPRIGSKGYGSFKVDLDRPLYEVSVD